MPKPPTTEPSAHDDGAHDFDASQVAELVRTLCLAGINEFDLQEKHRSLKIRLQRIHADPTRSSAKIEQLRSHAVGRFCLVHPFTGVSSRASAGPLLAGDIIGYLRVGQLLLPITPDRDLTLLRYLVDEGSLVGFGDPLCNVS